MIDLYPVSDADNSFINSGVAIYLGENAQLSHYRYQYDTASNYYVNNTRIFQDANSTYSSYVLDTGGKSVRNNLYTYLKGSNTNTNYYGGYLVSGKQHIDNQTFIDHAMPHCESNELYKGILDDRSSGVFNGKVMVRPDAQKTNAFQQNSNLVLSPDAKMNTKPQLEIYADDVKCSHGATVGQLDEQSMYYLRSRGLNKGEAKRLLQFAFIAEVVESFENDQMRDFAEQIVREKM
jgi:Fe-S cluster assembly protein SufD